MYINVGNMVQYLLVHTHVPEHTQTYSPTKYVATYMYMFYNIIPLLKPYTVCTYVHMHEP